MSETLDSTLNNDELVQHLELEREGYAGSHGRDALHNLHVASINRLQRQIGSHEEPLVQLEGGEHKLNMEVLERDLGTFGSILQGDLQRIRDVISDPRKASEVRAVIGDNGSSEGSLTLQDIHEYLFDLQNEIPEDDPDKEMRQESLQVVSSLVEHWRQEQVERGELNPLDDAELRADLMTHSREGVPLEKDHLELQKERFENMTRARIQSLGLAAMDAAGVRAGLSGRADDERSASQSDPESTANAESKMDPYSEEQDKLLSDPDTVDELIDESQHHFNSVILAGLQARAERPEATEQDRKALEEAHRTGQGLRELGRFRDSWNAQRQRGDSRNFGKFISDLKAAEDARAEANPAASRGIPPIYAAYRAGWSGQAHSLVGLAQRRAATNVRAMREAETA